MIEKSSILITSIGRTGTEFFANLFADIIADSTSLHEPDIIKFPGVKNRFEHYSLQARRAGLWRIFILKALGKWTLAKLSDSKFAGKIDGPMAAVQLHNQRSAFIAKMPGSLYVESNLGYYGLLDVIPEVFKHHKTVYIVRDGRDWVRSMVNWGEVYGKNGIRKLFAHRWPLASDVPGDAYADQWDTLSHFEQLCWAWSRLNAYALNGLRGDPNIRVFKFESIFLDEKKYQSLDELIAFATALPGITSTGIKQPAGWLEQKIHQSSSKFPDWTEWTNDQKDQFRKICGPLMEELEYKF